MGFEPMNTGFADQRVSHFAIGASSPRTSTFNARGGAILVNACSFRKAFIPLSQEFHIAADAYCGCVVVRRYGFTVL